LLDRIRDAVREIEPEAAIMLYGSRARGDSEADSDWDLLVLLDGLAGHERATAVRHRIYEVEWTHEDCPVLSAMVFSKQDWDTPLYKAMPFHDNVEREGIAL